MRVGVHRKMCAAILTATVVTGCTNGGNTSAAPPVLQPTTSAADVDSSEGASPTSAVSTKATPELTSLATLNATTTNGDAAEAVFSAGTATASPSDPFIAQCLQDLDPTGRSMAIPFHIRFTWKSSLPGSVSMMLGINVITVRSTPQPTCDNPAGFVALPNVMPGQTIEYDGAVELPGAIDPAHPQGDPITLANAIFQPRVEFGSSVDVKQQLSGTQCHVA